MKLSPRVYVNISGLGKGPLIPAHTSLTVESAPNLHPEWLHQPCRAAVRMFIGSRVPPRFAPALLPLLLKVPYSSGQAAS